MITQIPKEVLAVIRKELEWEDEHVPPIDLFSTYRNEDIEVHALLMTRIAFALKYKNPPNMTTNLNDWCLFILNEFVEYGADIGVPNIKSIIKIPDTNTIANAAETSIINNNYFVEADLDTVREIVNGLLVGHYGVPTPIIGR